MCRDDFWFATILGQPLSDASIWPPHFPMKIPAECIHRRTICVATTNRICAESPIRPVNPVRVNDTNTMSSFPKSCLSMNGGREMVKKWFLRPVKPVTLHVHSQYSRRELFHRFWFQRSTCRWVHHATEPPAVSRHLLSSATASCHHCPMPKCCPWTKHRKLFALNVYPKSVCVWNQN